MDLKDARILLVDDEPMLRDIMCQWLGRVVGKVICVDHGEQALQALATQQIDLIISDVRMPVMDGITLLKKINAIRGHRPRVIFITGFSDLSLREVLDLGAEAVLEKPIEREDLLNEARRCLTDPEQLWQEPVHAATQKKLALDFESVAAALRQKRIAFGRRGFSIKSPALLHLGPVDFSLDFKAEQCTISGQGTVRWTMPQEQQAGIEVIYLEDAGRKWMLQLMQRYEPVSFIPGSTGVGQVPKLETA